MRTIRWKAARRAWAMLLASALFAHASWASGFLACAPSATPNAPVALTFGGDVMLSRGVAPYIEAHGAAYPFEGLAAPLDGDDLSIVNLECPLTERDEPVYKPARYLFRAPAACAAAMRRAGIDVAVLANNHAFDQGANGLTDTLDALAGAGIDAVGAGVDRMAAEAARFYDIRGMRIGILALSGLPVEGFFYDEDAPTVAYARGEGYIERIRETARGCDVAIVYLHAGREFDPTPTQAQRDMAAAAVGAGAKLVVFAHSHVVGPIEEVDGVPVAYGLGNLVFDAQEPAGTDRALLLRVAIDREGVAAIERVEGRIEAGRPVFEP